MGRQESIHPHIPFTSPPFIAYLWREHPYHTHTGHVLGHFTAIYSFCDGHRKLPSLSDVWDVKRIQDQGPHVFFIVLTERDAKTGKCLKPAVCGWTWYGCQ